LKNRADALPEFVGTAATRGIIGEHQLRYAAPTSKIDKQFKHRKSVDLPPPDRPIIEIRSPLSMLKLMVSNTAVSP
jgi:hypothetical protein